MFARRFDREVAALPQMPSDWLAGLWILVKSLKREEYKAVDALLRAVADDFAGGVMLNWLLDWLPKAGRADGAVYKSAPEWQSYVGLTRHQVDRVNKHILPKCGFTITIKKANGSPTNHYYFDGWKFLHRVSEVLRLPSSYLLKKMQKAGNGFDGIRKMDLTESAKSLTESTTKKTTKKHDGGVSSATVARLIEIGVMGSVAETLADKPLEAVESILKQAYRLKSEGELKTLTGFVVSKLREWQPTPPPNPLPVAAAETADYQSDDEPETVTTLGRRLGETLGDYLRRLEAESVLKAAEPEPANERLLVRLNEFGRMTAQEAWSATYNQLELQLDCASFDTWLRSAKLLDYEDGVLVIGVHNSYAVDMLQHRLYRNVARILRDVTGKEVEVRFEVHKANGKDANTMNYAPTKFLKPTTDN